MSPYAFKVVSVLVLLATSCLRQDRGGVDSAVAVWPIRNVLRMANVSGSLAYWGQCGYHMSRPDFPTVRRLSNYSGPPLEVLKTLFADDPHMRVTQEPSGRIRMVETDVPSDLLDVKISHISFGPIIVKREKETPTSGGPNLTVFPASITSGVPNFDGKIGHISFNPIILKPAKQASTLGGPHLTFGPASMTLGGPGMALEFILSTPELSTFKRANNIRPFSTGGWALPGNSGSEPPVVGELDNVTLSQALDYVLKTFPGFWVYENCPSEDGGRTVLFNFY